MNNKILVFGGGGFLGRHLIKKLCLNNSNEVTVFDINENIEIPENCAFIKGSIFDPNDIQKTFEANNYDFIYYLISATIPKSSWEDPGREITSNLVPFMELLESNPIRSIKKFIFLSSGGTVYGLKSGYINEDTAKTPFSPYGIFKSTMEQLLEYYNQRYGLNYDIFRVSNVYGPGQNVALGLGVINTWLEKIIKKEQLVLFGDGKHIRDYVYVEDVAEVLALSVSKPHLKPRILNLGAGTGISLDELLLLIKEIVNEEIELIKMPARNSDNKIVILDNTKLLKEFGLKSAFFTPLKEGIQKTYEFIKNKKA